MTECDIMSDEEIDLHSCLYLLATPTHTFTNTTHTSRGDISSRSAASMKSLVDGETRDMYIHTFHECYSIFIDILTTTTTAGAKTSATSASGRIYHALEGDNMA